MFLRDSMTLVEKKFKIKKHAKLQKFMRIVCKILSLHAVNVFLLGEGLLSYKGNQLNY